MVSTSHWCYVVIKDRRNKSPKTIHLHLYIVYGRMLLPNLMIYLTLNKTTCDGFHLLKLNLSKQLNRPLFEINYTRNTFTNKFIVKGVCFIWSCSQPHIHEYKHARISQSMNYVFLAIYFNHINDPRRIPKLEFICHHAIQIHTERPHEISSNLSVSELSLFPLLVCWFVCLYNSFFFLSFYRSFKCLMSFMTQVNWH